MERLKKMTNKRLPPGEGGPKGGGGGGERSKHFPKSEGGEGEEGGLPSTTDEVEAEEAPQIPDDLSILDALTAIPVVEDEILYAVPVCAPYTSMSNFK